MSIVLAKSFVYRQVSLQTLRDKVVAIDILPWLYKYLFTIGKENKLVAKIPFNYHFLIIKHKISSK